MTNAVFTTRITPSYDDVPEKRYHFPRRYLPAVQEAVGDLIVYYEPRRSGVGADGGKGGRQCYFALARVREVVPDPADVEHFYAYVDSFQSFVTPVPFRTEELGYLESGGERDDGGTSKGFYGWSVRRVPRPEFERIVGLGMAMDLKPYEAPLVTPTLPVYGFAEEGAAYEVERPKIETTLTRPYRDRAFRRVVRDAYDNRCAVSGLRLLNGGGRPEVQAAHIQAVEDRGPDSIRNGLALSGTFHWLFDRGLISVDKDYRILTAKGQIPEELLPLFPKNGYLRVPDDHRLRPHDVFLRHHRETRFKG